MDSRIRTLVENGVKLNERTLFVVVGDRAREQVVNLHYMLSKAVVKSRPNVLWCYKKELYLSSHKKKRVKQIKKMVSRGLMDPENEDPFVVVGVHGHQVHLLRRHAENIGEHVRDGGAAGL